MLRLLGRVATVLIWLIHWSLASSVVATLAATPFGWLLFPFAFSGAVVVVLVFSLLPVVVLTLLFEMRGRKVRPSLYGVVGALNSVAALLILYGAQGPDPIDGGISKLMQVLPIWEVAAGVSPDMRVAASWVWLGVSAFVGGVLFGLLRRSLQKSSMLHWLNGG